MNYLQPLFGKKIISSDLPAAGFNGYFFFWAFQNSADNQVKVIKHYLLDCCRCNDP